MSDITLQNNYPEVGLEPAFHAPNGYIIGGQAEHEKYPHCAELKTLADALDYGRTEGLSINQFRTNPHEEDRASTHDRKVRERVDGFQRNFVVKFDNALASVKTALQRVEDGIAEKAGLKPNMAIANLTVGTLQGMKNDGERMAAVNEMVDDGDYETLATLMAVPRFATQLPREFLNGLRERVFAKVDPQGFELRDHLKVVLERADKASFASLDMFHDLRSGTAPGEWRERAKQAALAAERDRLANKR